MKSHYIPKMHLYSFTETRELDDHHRPKSMLHVVMRGGRDFRTKNLADICSEEDFYENPNMGRTDTMEKILADYEDKLNPKMEKIREFQNAPDGRNVAVSYAAMLLVRTKHVRGLIDELAAQRGLANPEGLGE